MFDMCQNNGACLHFLNIILLTKIKHIAYAKHGQLKKRTTCNRVNDWTGPLTCLSLFSLELVDKIRLRTGNTAFPVKFSPMKVRQRRVKVFYSNVQHFMHMEKPVRCEKEGSKLPLLQLKHSQYYYF